MPKKGYNFNDIESVLTRIIVAEPYPSSTMLTDLKKELNKFFTEAECLDIIFTKNTDKLFFGMCVMPVLQPSEVLDIVLSNEKMTIKKYYLEIDSKILQIVLTADELSAVLLHEIGHIVIDEKPIQIVRANIDKYLADKDEVIALKDSVQYNQLLSFAIKDTIQKVTSLMNRENDELVADAFVSACGYGDHLVSAHNKILHNMWGLSKDVSGPKLLILDWVFRLYTNVKFNRIPALKTLKKSKNFTASQLSKKEVDRVIDALNKIDTDIVREAAYLLEAVSKKSSFFGRLKTNGLRSIEEDYYEYKIRVKNAETEDEAMYILRQINSRLTILQDFLQSEDITEQEYDKWHGILVKFKELRADISSKKIYNKKNYGLWYNYNQIDDDTNKMY